LLVGDRVGMNEALTAAPVPERADVSVLFSRCHEEDGHQMAHDADTRPAHLEQIYERWVSAFGEYSGFSPALVVPDPARAAPEVFMLFRTESALLRVVDGSNGFCSSWPEGPGEEHADLISILRDWMNTSDGQSSVQAESGTSRALDEHIKAGKGRVRRRGERTVFPSHWGKLRSRCHGVLSMSKFSRSSWFGSEPPPETTAQPLPAPSKQPGLRQQTPLPPAGIVPGQER
jgi:hypothetical protein